MEIEKVLAELGWAQDLAQPTYWDTAIGGRGGTYPVTLEVNSATEALFDKIYSIGFKDGVERGAYEEMTQEDAEPVKHVENKPLSLLTSAQIMQMISVSGENNKYGEYNTYDEYIATINDKNTSPSITEKVIMAMCENRMREIEKENFLK